MRAGGSVARAARVCVQYTVAPPGASRSQPLRHWQELRGHSHCAYYSTVTVLFCMNRLQYIALHVQYISTVCSWVEYCYAMCYSCMRQSLQYIYSSVKYSTLVDLIHLISSLNRYGIACSARSRPSGSTTRTSCAMGSCTRSPRSIRGVFRYCTTLRVQYSCEQRSIDGRASIVETGHMRARGTT